jgi:glycogen debranching enzyme
MTDSMHKLREASLVQHAAHLENGEERTDRYVLHSTGTANVPKISLKRGDIFMVADVRGDLRETEQETGIFWQGTRFLRTCDLFLAGLPLQHLSHTVADEGDRCQIDLCNSSFPADAEATVQQGTIHVRREIILDGRQIIQRIIVTSYHPRFVEVLLGLKIGADFRDILEIRGMTRSRRGKLPPPQMHPDTLIYRYHGLDNVVRETHLTLSPPVTHTIPEGVFWNLTLQDRQPVTIEVVTDLNEEDPPGSANGSHNGQPAPEVAIPAETHTDNVFFDRLLKRSMYDLSMMSTLTPEGFYPYGGIPWYVCPFGRDGLITSLEFMPWFPEVARGTLAFLAAHQGKQFDSFTEEEPGKILHEFRHGEMANLREIPFVPYYGTIDATPLFIMTMESYIRWTDDQEFLRQLWPHVEAAARWMIECGDIDGDGFLEYRRKLDSGLINQGWKDSWDAVSHADGTLAEAPIALCEVQGYAYAAYRGMGYLLRRLGRQKEARQWSNRAEALRDAFFEQFWWEEEGMPYMALDGQKRPCKVVASNAGHCLWTGIIPSEHADRTIERLTRDDMYTEWGVRTLSAGAARYNPMSYHNGSVWPHDTAIAGAGFARYMRKDAAGMLLGNLFGISLYYERARLPELLCGFPRHHGYGPTQYPVACWPQSWAAGAPYLLLSAVLGFQPAAEKDRLTLDRPMLPDWLNEMDLPDVRLGNHTIHLHLTLHKGATAIHAVDSGGADIHITAR